MQYSLGSPQACGYVTVALVNVFINSLLDGARSPSADPEVSSMSSFLGFAVGLLSSISLSS